MQTSVDQELAARAQGKGSNAINSLKAAVLMAKINQTNDFRSSIFMAKPTNQGKVIGQGTSYDLPEYEAESIKKSETVKESTLATTTNIFNNHILPVLGNIYVDKLTVAKCQSIAQQWRKEAPRTFKRYIRYANNVLDYGVNLELLVSNPMRKIVRPKVKRQVKKQFNDFYNKEALETFLQDCKACKFTKIFTFFRVLAYSGMRKEEIYALTWNDVNFDNGTISINKALKYGKKHEPYINATKTKNGVRALNMDNKTMQELKKWKLEQAKELFKIGINADANKDQLVFSSNKNSWLSADKPRQWVLKVCNKYNLKYVTVRGFRHTHASLLANAGVLPKQAQLRLGHAKFETTMNIYTQGTKDMEKDAVNRFSKYMSN